MTVQFLSLLLIGGGVLIGCVLLLIAGWGRRVRAGGRLGRTDGDSIKGGEVGLMTNLAAQLNRMEERIENLETILLQRSGR